MKRNMIKWVFGALSLFALISCQDVVTYDDGYDDGMTSTGAPKIDAIYDITDTACTTALSEGSLKEMLHIKGSNLSHIKSIMFNDIAVQNKDVYATAKDAYVTIPRVLPSTVTDKITYETDLGSVKYDFKVSIPALSVEGLYNEFALPGDTVQVVGDFFDLYGFGTDKSSVKLNGTESVTIDSISTTYMSIVIPKDAKENSIITLECQNSSGVKMDINIPYRQTQSCVWPDLSNPGQYGLWAGTNYITDGKGKNEPTPLYGPYVRVKGIFSAWSWNNLPCGGFNLSNSDAANNIGNYYFKFEVNSASGSPFYDSGSAGYIFQLNGGQYAWNPSKDVSFNTFGHWRTISIPLKDFATKGVVAGWNNLYLILQPNSNWEVEHNFANFRIEKQVF